MPSAEAPELRRAIHCIDEPVWLLDDEGRLAVARSGEAAIRLSSGDASENPAPGARGKLHPIRAYAPPYRLELLGDPAFCAAHRLRYPYIAGAMANGVGSAEIVEAMARAGMLGFFGAAGLPLTRTEAAIDRIQTSLQDGDGFLPHGFNLIHSPSEPDLEAGTVDLYLRRNVHLVSASAYLNLTLPLVRYRVRGIHRNQSGEIVTPNRVIAKVSRVEVAARFFSPPPEKYLRALLEAGEITALQAELAASVPMAEDLTAEADSAGHTDNQPFLALLPTMLALRDELQSKHGYARELRVGAAGGIGTPGSAAAAFSMGAAYILTGSINQACVEAGTSSIVREMLRLTRQSDVTMAPAADMFEMGVRVQVLKRGSMFPMRASKLYEIYRSCGSLEEIPAPQRAMLEKDLFRASIKEVWDRTRRFFEERDPSQIGRAEKDPKHRMALIFRWYLGQSSHWANEGDAERKVDYQIWCGPAMGAFNEWVKGSYLEKLEERRVVTVALNLLMGAAILNRIQNLRAQGVALAPEISRIRPVPLGRISTTLLRRIEPPGGAIK